MVIHCPYCHKASKIDFEIEDGRRVQCPYCLAKFKHRYHAYEGHDIRTWFFKLYERITHVCCVQRRKPLIVGGIILFLLTLIAFRTSCVSEKSPYYGGSVSLRTYHSTEKTKFDFRIRATREGAFGFFWGEHPMSKEYDTPCEVEYNITNGLFSRLRLTYDEKGELFMISLCAYERSFPSIPRGLPVDAQRKIRMAYMDVALSTFQVMQQVAEQITDQEFVCCRFEDKLLGVSECHGVGYSAGVRIDLPPRKNPERVFFVVRE